MRTYKVSSSVKVEFSREEREQLEILRQYADGLRELRTRLTQEFSDCRELAGIAQDLSTTVTQIVELELKQLKSTLRGELPTK